MSAQRRGKIPDLTASPAEHVLGRLIRLNTTEFDNDQLHSYPPAGIWVAAAVMVDTGVPDMLTEADAAESLDEFKTFLDEVEPEDFEA